MTIDKQKLVELLVEKTGFNEEKIENQLSELVKRIKKAAEVGKSFEVEGFGTFSVENDTLHFVPAEPVQTEINHKYTGMKPIELIGAFKETGDQPVPGTGEDDEEDIKEAGPEPEPEAGTGEEAPAWGFDEEAADAEKREAEKQEEKEEDEERKEKKPVFEFDETAEVPEEPEDEIEEPIEKKEEPEQVEAPSAKKKKVDRQKVKKEKPAESDPIGKVLIYSVVILVILVAGWFVYDSGILERSGDTSGQQVQQEPQTTEEVPPEALEQQQGQQETGGDDRLTGETGEPGEQTDSGSGEQEITEESVYGLKGEVQPGAGDGYTIVIHSLTDETKARTITENMQQQGYRSVLMSAVVNGRTYWRVGLGQFESVESAQDATGTLPERFRENHFIKRIQ